MPREQKLPYDDDDRRRLFCDTVMFGYPPGYNPYDKDNDQDSMSKSSNKPGTSIDDLDRKVTHITIWKDDNSPAYDLKDGWLEETKKHVKVAVPRSRFDAYNCSKFPNGYNILVSDESGDDPDGLIYEGTVDISVIKLNEGTTYVLMKCLPSKLTH